MFRPTTVLGLIAALGSGSYLYAEKHQAALLDRTIGQVVQATRDARARSVQLQAEWALLNDPERLQDMADRYLMLQPLAPGQFVALPALGGRLPPVASPDAPADAVPTIYAETTPPVREAPKAEAEADVGEEAAPSVEAAAEPRVAPAVRAAPRVAARPEPPRPEPARPRAPVRMAKLESFDRVMARLMRAAPVPAAHPVASAAATQGTLGFLGSARGVAPVMAPVMAPVAARPAAARWAYAPPRPRPNGLGAAPGYGYGQSLPPPLPYAPSPYAPGSYAPGSYAQQGYDGRD